MVISLRTGFSVQPAKYSPTQQEKHVLNVPQLNGFTTRRRNGNSNSIRILSIPKQITGICPRKSLVEKVAIEKKAKEKEKTKREELEAEMIALEEEDHSDLKTIMSNVNKENVPDDMKLLWEQQESILKASSVKGYRWHPR